MPPVEVGADGLTFRCPRCDTEVVERFYGPCGNCRHQLAASVAGEQREIETARFAPAMHVTPNAVATKE